MKKMALFSLLLVLGALLLSACGAESGTNAESGTSAEVVSSKSETLLIGLEMHVRNDTLQMTAPLGHLYESTTNPTPLLTAASIIVGTCKGSYSTTAHQAIICVTTVQFNLINSMLAQEPGHSVDLRLAYDTAGTSTTKTITSFDFFLI